MSPPQRSRCPTRHVSNCFHFPFGELTFIFFRSSPFLTSEYILILTTPRSLTILRCSGWRGPPRDNRHEHNKHLFPQKMFTVGIFCRTSTWCAWPAQRLPTSRASPAATSRAGAAGLKVGPVYRATCCTLDNSRQRAQRGAEGDLGAAVGAG